MFRTTLLTAALAVFAAAPSLAQNYDRTIKLNKRVLAGDSILLDAFRTLNVDCTANPIPRINLIRTPDLGRVLVKREMMNSTFGKDNPRFKCNRRKSPSQTVHYRALDNAAGTDKVEFEVYWYDGEVWKIDATVNVR